jgi:hypothetical protein
VTISKCLNIVAKTRANHYSTIATRRKAKEEVEQGQGYAITTIITVTSTSTTNIAMSIHPSIHPADRDSDHQTLILARPQLRTKRTRF